MITHSRQLPVEDAVKTVRTVPLTAAVIAVAAVIAGSVGTQSATAVTPKVPSRASGMPWASGAYMPQFLPSAQTSFGNYRGAKSDVAMVYTGRSSWSDVVDPGWLWNAWKNAPQTLVISSAPYPDLAGTTLAKCGHGTYDNDWKRFGASVAASGMANRVVVRLAWEFNGSWVPWAARKPQDFVSCWRHIFTAAEKEAPALRWDWTVNRGPGDALADPTKAWPGQKYVDFVGIDSYDGWPPVTNRTNWNIQYAGPGGLKYWAAFAKRKGKRLSVPEWGLYPGTAWAGHNGGDNPLYISKMFGFFRSLGSQLAYETYFNDPAPAHASALNLNPKGSAEYKRQIKAARAMAKAAAAAP
jgi:hypothetical protein